MKKAATTIINKINQHLERKHFDIIRSGIGLDEVGAEMIEEGLKEFYSKPSTKILQAVVSRLKEEVKENVKA